MSVEQQLEEAREAYRAAAAELDELIGAAYRDPPPPGPEMSARIDAAEARRDAASQRCKDVFHRHLAEIEQGRDRQAAVST